MLPGIHCSRDACRSLLRSTDRDGVCQAFALRIHLGVLGAEEFGVQCPALTHLDLANGPAVEHDLTARHGGALLVAEMPEQFTLDEPLLGHPTGLCFLGG